MSKYKLVTFDETNLEHLKIKEALDNDPVVKKYLSNISTFLEEDSSYDLDHAYLVGTDDNIVGYINLLDYGEFVEMHYAVLNAFRGMRDNSKETVGCQMVKELSTSILQSHQNVEYLKLFIDASNIRSIKTAQKAGFIEVESNNTFEELRKYQIK